MAIAQQIKQSTAERYGTPADKCSGEADTVEILSSPRSRVSLLGTLVDKVDMVEAANRVNDFIRLGTPQQVVTVNLDFLRLSEQDRSFQDLINEAGLVVADGMPLVWAAGIMGDPLPERVAGVDLVLECARKASKEGHTIFLLGAAPGVAERAASVLRERCPGVQVVGTHAPPSTGPDDDKVTLALIKAVQPDMLFVAFGAPRQDQWIRKHKETLGVPVCIGVGGALDMLSGRIKRAPVWMRRTGMEWLYRFAMEPRRLFKRYFLQDLPVFVRLLLWSSLTTANTGPAASGEGTPTQPANLDPSLALIVTTALQRPAYRVTLPEPPAPKN